MPRNIFELIFGSVIIISILKLRGKWKDNNVWVTQSRERKKRVKCQTGRLNLRWLVRKYFLLLLLFSSSIVLFANNFCHRAKWTCFVYCQLLTETVKVWMFFSPSLSLPVPIFKMEKSCSKNSSQNRYHNEPRFFPFFASLFCFFSFALRVVLVTVYYVSLWYVWVCIMCIEFNCDCCHRQWQYAYFEYKAWIISATPSAFVAHSNGYYHLTFIPFIHRSVSDRNHHFHPVNMRSNYICNRSHYMYSFVLGRNW